MGGAPSHHPFLDGIFHGSQLLGYPDFRKTHPDSALSKTWIPEWRLWVREGPRVIIHFHFIFHEINQPSIGVPPIYGWLFRHIPLKNMTSSTGMIRHSQDISGKILKKWQPNHQPDGNPATSNHLRPSATLAPSISLCFSLISSASASGLESNQL